MEYKRQKLVQELAGFDVLADVLATLGLRSRLFCRSELSAPWIMAFSGGQLAHFHIVERGTAWLETQSAAAPIAVAPGDVVVVARGSDYRLSDQPDRRNVRPVALPRPDPSGRCILVKQGRGGATSVLICGSFSFEEAEDHPVLALLPEVMHLRSGAAPSDGWLESMSRFLIAEASTMKPGAATIVSRLTDILLVQVLRAWLAEQPDQPSWLRGLNDARIGPALALIHERPSETWTVEKLAAQVSLSRSPFTVRFRRVVGETPQTYITRVRMQRAARLIREQDASLGRVALAVGYESESAFNKAFKRQYRKTPGQFRREHRQNRTLETA
jgi:AraC-like DNA-binding protein